MSELFPTGKGARSFWLLTTPDGRYLQTEDHHYWLETHRLRARTPCCRSKAEAERVRDRAEPHVGPLVIVSELLF